MKTRRMLLKEAKDDQDKGNKKKPTKVQKEKKNTSKPDKKPQKKRFVQSSSSSSPQPDPKKKKNRRPARQSSDKQSPKKKVKKQQSPQKKQKAKSKPNKQKQSLNKVTKSSSQQKVKKAKKSPKKEMKTITMTGSVPVDEHFPIKGYHVFEEQGKVYAATLNQTKVMTNNNKFYVLQILQNDRKNSYYFWTRWGRVGKVGQNSNINCHSKQQAKRLYEQKFHEKNVRGEYKHIELNYQPSSQEDEKKKKKSKSKSKEKDNSGSAQGVIKQRVKDFTQSGLHSDIKNLIKLIFDTDMMDKQMKQIGYDSTKMPLGKLSKDTILKGYKALNKLMEQIQKKNPDSSVIQDLNNTFYSYIPHDFGFTKMQHHILRNKKQVEEKLQMLESLQNITVARKLLKSNEEDVNIIDQNYAKLDRDIEVINNPSRQYQIIEEYLKNTHAATHASYRLKIQSVFKLKKQSEEQRYTNEINNKMLLWHGSRLTNYVGILSQGLRIAPPQAPVTGYMFGKGVYFADMVSKSANYCFTNPTNNTGLLLLCEVALGGMNQKFQSDYYADLLPPGKNSTKGVGKTFPPQDSYVDLDGVQVPIGQSKTEQIQTSLLYNQYIVYKVSQVKLKYLLRVKFEYKKP